MGWIAASALPPPMTGLLLHSGQGDGFAVGADGDEDEVAFGDQFDFVAGFALDLGSDFDSEAGAANAFGDGVTGEAIAYEDGLVEGHVVDGDGDKAGGGEAAHMDVGGQVHLAYDPAAEHIAIGVGVAGHGDDFDDELGFCFGEGHGN